MSRISLRSSFLNLNARFSPSGVYLRGKRQYRAASASLRMSSEVSPGHSVKTIGFPGLKNRISSHRSWLRSATRGIAGRLSPLAGKSRRHRGWLQPNVALACFLLKHDHSQRFFCTRMKRLVEPWSNGDSVSNAPFSS